MAEALRRSEEEQKVEVYRPLALVNSDRLQIAVDLSKDLKKVTPPTFHGRTSREDAGAWITSMEKYFMIHNYTGKSRVVWGMFHLMGEAGTWWENVMAEKKLQHGEVTWEEFLQLFHKRCLPNSFMIRNH